MDRIELNGKNGPKWTKMEESGGMDQSEPNWTKMDRYGLKCTRVPIYYLYLLKLIKMTYNLSMYVRAKLDPST